MPGFRVGKKENKLGMRASATGEVIFTDCRVPESQLLGKQGEGFVDSLRILDGGRISIAALSVGMAQGAYDAALKYSKQRKQFGRPISEFQAIQNKLVDMATEIDAARLLTYRAGWMKDRGQRVTKESAMAKLFASEIAVRVANEAVQIHGGYGFIKDYPVEKFYRDVKLCTIGEGTSEIQRLVIARQLLKRVQLNGLAGEDPRRRSARARPRRHRDRKPIARCRIIAEGIVSAYRTRQRHRHHRPARRGQEHAGGSSGSRASPRRRKPSAFSRSIPPALTPAARFWATASAC